MFRKIHRTNALVLAIFICAHLTNHALVLGGVEVHLSAMKVLRIFYRPLLVEILIYFLFGVQVLLGLVMMYRQRRPKNNWGWAQYISGGVLAFFLIQHLSAVLVTRTFNPGVDTNVYWAASVLSREPFVWYFGPYYALGIISLFVHVAAAMRKRVRFRPYANLVTASGLLTAAIVVPYLMGWYTQPINLPPEHLSYIDNFFTNF